MKTLDAAKAYIAAGYSAPDEKSAERLARMLKGRASVKNYIERLTQTEEKLTQNEERLSPDEESVLALLGAIAFSSPADMGKIVEENGEQRFVWKRFDEMDDGTKRAIAIIKNTRCGIEMETLDRMKAIDMLLKHLGIEHGENDAVVITGENEIAE